MKKRNYLFLVLALILILAGCSATTVKKTKGISVVATTDFYGEVAKAVLGSNGSVTSIINNPNIDPHDFEPTTKTAKTVANSDILLYNGIGYDSWAKKLSGAKKIAVGEDIMHKKDGDNEHLWYNNKTMSATAKYLAVRFGKIDSKHKAEYQKNAKKYISSLSELTTLIKQIRKNSNNKLVDVSEPVFDYALKDMGYKINNVHFSNSVEKGTDPSPSDIKNMQNDIKKQKIAFFVQNTQASDKVVKNLVAMCKKYNVPVVNVTETLPTGKNYLQWMKEEYQQVLNIQKK
ncbi:metal ABC transporter solute-binding protein [Liquorilactobacillus cacaonum]|uniref:ABC transporter substrate-binding protein n=1 Tax=Liquorilactobacillus cacaonum DSM 21116 TaxID=1423729 RepID=A0A0R2CKS5_9LACO|nr:metal ABC transporter solute-binding protein [Liquorilactobacillus cacaonum]KRM92223.1 ABC transporter substrate-binding protein [Liquorilactobacillus cacaonum DSM 21116]